MTAPPALAPPQVSGPTFGLGRSFERRIDTELARFVGSTPEARALIIARLQTVDPALLRFSSPKNSAAIVRELSTVQRTLKLLFDVTSGEGELSQEELARTGKANCFGSTQVFLAVARAQGLRARPIHVEHARSGMATLHVASLVHLPDGRVATVDVLYDDAVSAPFDLRRRYRDSGRALEISSAETGTTYAQIRLLDDKRFNVFLASQLLDTHDATSIAALRELARRDPANPWIQQTLGDTIGSTIDASNRALVPVDPKAEMLAAYRAVLALDPNHAGAWRDSADILHERGDLSGASTAYDRAAALIEQALLRQMNSRAAPGEDDATVARAASDPNVGFVFDNLIEVLERRARLAEAAGDSAATQRLVTRIASLRGPPL